MSLATDLNTGGVIEAMADRFAAADAARAAELDRLIRAGKGDKEPPRRAPQVVAREDGMPRKVKPQPKGPCQACGSRTCHKGWCPNRPGGPLKGSAGTRPQDAPTAAPEAKSAAAPKRQAVVRSGSAPVSVQPDLALYPVDALLDLRRLVEAELQARAEKLEADLAAIRGA